MASNVRINPDVHKIMVEHLLKDDRKISRFTENAILEKVEKEKKKNNIKSSKNGSNNS